MIAGPGPVVSPPSVSTSSSSASPASLIRTGRLRGLSYLRSYTQGYLHSNPDQSTTQGRTTHERSRSRPSHSSRSWSNSNQSFAASFERGPYSEAETTLRAFQQSTTDSLHPLHRSLNGTQSFTTGWLPTAGGSGGISAPTTQILPDALPPYSVPTAGSTSSRAGSTKRNMVRSRSATTPNGSATMTSVTQPQFGITTPEIGTSGRTRATLIEDAVESASIDQPDAYGLNAIKSSQMPSIQLISHHEPRQSRPSLIFASVSRTLPNNSAVIRVGRYSEKDTAPDVKPNVPSDAPIGFKSKVVSRRHCEFTFANNQWYVKDVKSSSGTFLNHIRLSQPGLESPRFPVKDGDIVQLGIDFKGGEEMIFRCVKIRLECNRGWQKSLNNYKYVYLNHVFSAYLELS